MIAPARRAAFRALIGVCRDGRDSASALARERKRLDDPRDVALAAELVTGTLRWQAALDAALEPLVARGIARLDTEVLVALRLGAYQRLFLQRIPPSAAVNDAVSLVRAAGLGSAAGMVNAVLRRLDADGVRAHWPARPSPASARPGAASDLPRGDDTAAQLDYLSVTLSHPRWLTERWLGRYGFEGAEAWTRFDNTPAPLTLRPVRWRISRHELEARLAEHGVATEHARFAADALLVTKGQPFQSPLAGTAIFAAQDEASQLIAELVVALRPTSVLDVCASPGGKTAAIRGGLGPGPVIVACDLRPRRVELLAAALSETAAPGIGVVRCDATMPLPFSRAFDVVLLDAPCSGLGTIRREPEIRWRRDPADLAKFAAVQRRMLERAADRVARGGNLVYATCSSEPEENEEVVAGFLESDGRFERLEVARHPWHRGPLATLIDTRGDMRTLPHAHGLEAFFAAVLCRRPEPPC